MNERKTKIFYHCRVAGNRLCQVIGQGREFCGVNEWPSGLNNFRQVTEVKLG